MKTQAELLKELLDRKSHVLVIDSNELLKAPEQYLNLLFSKLNIPFYKEMLSWEIGPKSYDGPWAPHWYSNVHNSTGFQSYEEKALTVPEHLNDLLNEALPYYLELKKHSLTLV
jgi:hypothetical protein